MWLALFKENRDFIVWHFNSWLFDSIAYYETWILTNVWLLWKCAVNHSSSENPVAGVLWLLYVPMFSRTIFALRVCEQSEHEFTGREGKNKNTKRWTVIDLLAYKDQCTQFIRHKKWAVSIIQLFYPLKAIFPTCAQTVVIGVTDILQCTQLKPWKNEFNCLNKPIFPFFILTILPKQLKILQSRRHAEGSENSELETGSNFNTIFPTKRKQKRTQQEAVQSEPLLSFHRWTLNNANSSHNTVEWIVFRPNSCDFSLIPPPLDE